MTDLVVSQPYTMELVRDVAINWAPDPDLCEIHGIDQRHLDRLREYPPFVKALAAMRKALDENGVTAAYKAKIVVEDLIPDMRKVVKSSSAPEKDKVAAFLALMKLGKMGGTEEPSQPGGGVQVFIDLGGGKPRDVTDD